MSLIFLIKIVDEVNITGTEEKERKQASEGVLQKISSLSLQTS